MSPDQHRAMAETLLQRANTPQATDSAAIELGVRAAAHALLAQPQPINGELVTSDLKASNPIGRDGWLLCLLIAAVILGTVWLVTR